jgi:hypothetical protein
MAPGSVYGIVIEVISGPFPKDFPSRRRREVRWRDRPGAAFDSEAVPESKTNGEIRSEKDSLPARWDR